MYKQPFAPKCQKCQVYLQSWEGGCRGRVRAEEGGSKSSEIGKKQLQSNSGGIRTSRVVEQYLHLFYLGVLVFAFTAEGQRNTCIAGVWEQQKTINDRFKFNNLS